MEMIDYFIFLFFKLIYNMYCRNMVLEVFVVIVLGIFLVF